MPPNTQSRKEFLEVALDWHTAGKSDDGQIVEEKDVREVALSRFMRTLACWKEGINCEEGRELGMSRKGESRPAACESVKDLPRSISGYLGAEAAQTHLFRKVRRDEEVRIRLGSHSSHRQREKVANPLEK